MSHYDIHFTGTKDEKERQALRACASYLGKARFNKMTQAIAKELQGASCRQAYRSVRFNCPFIGIQGYWPIRAMFKHIWPLI